MKKVVFYAVFVIALSSAASAQARDRCERSSDCTAPQQCNNYSSSVYVNCNRLGRLFGCKNASGGCSLFCSNEVSFALHCTPPCTNNNQCQQGETCKGSTTRKFCTRL